MKTTPQTRTEEKRTFRWGISSSAVEFMRASEVDAARDGSNCNDCSAVSPLPHPRRAPGDATEDPK